MCGAFGVTSPENIMDRFNLSDPFGRWGGSYNIRPMQPAPIITKNSPLKGLLATFGFIPSWSKEAKPKIQPINAKAENVAISGFFKAAFLHTRCLVPAEFYYEWQKVHDRMPVILHREDEETWLDKEADPKELMHLLRPYDGELISWKVSKAVGNVRNDGPEPIKPI